MPFLGDPPQKNASVYSLGFPQNSQKKSIYRSSVAFCSPAESSTSGGLMEKLAKKKNQGLTSLGKMHQRLHTLQTKVKKDRKKKKKKKGRKKGKKRRRKKTTHAPRLFLPSFFFGGDIPSLARTCASNCIASSAGSRGALLFARRPGGRYSSPTWVLDSPSSKVFFVFFLVLHPGMQPLGVDPGTFPDKTVLF